MEHGSTNPGTCGNAVGHAGVKVVSRALNQLRTQASTWGVLRTCPPQIQGTTISKPQKGTQWICVGDQGAVRAAQAARARECARGSRESIVRGSSGQERVETWHDVDTACLWEEIGGVLRLPTFSAVATRVLVFLTVDRIGQGEGLAGGGSLG